MEGEVQLTLIYPTKLLLTANNSGMKKTYPSMYNPILKTKTLLLTMVTSDPGLTITSLNGKHKLKITKDTFPNMEDTFKKYFTCEWEKESPKQKEKVRLGCTLNGNRTLSNMKHSEKPSRFLQWLSKEKLYIEADALGFGKTKTIGYITGIHPRIANRMHTKERLSDTLNTTFIPYEEATKLDSSLTINSSMQDTGEEPTVHCPVFELFHTTIGIGSKPRVETDVIGIKCQSSRAALLCEFLLKSTDKLEQQGQGKFIPAGLANIIGTETMQTIIQTNNQYLKTLTSIPINRISPNALKIEILIAAEEGDEDQEKITVYDYFQSADWCYGFELTDHEGQYLLVTTHHELSEAREWLDDHLEQLFTEYIPKFQTFMQIDGYEYPKRGDKPRFSHQLGTYADQLHTLYAVTVTNKTTDTKWNKSPIHKNNTTTNRTFDFNTEEYPALPTKKAKHNQTGEPKPQEPKTQPITEAMNLTTAKTLRDQIMDDIKTDMTKTISQEIATFRTEITEQLATLSKTIMTNFNAQIAEGIATIQALNQRFSEVMEHLPTNPPSTPAHQKPKGLGVTN